MLMSILVVHYFILLSSSLLYGYTRICPFTYWWTVSFHFLVIMNKYAMKICFQVFGWICFHSPRRRIAGSCVKCTRVLNCFPKWLYTPNSGFSSMPLNIDRFYKFSHFSVLQYHTVVLICIILITNDVKNLFMCLSLSMFFWAVQVQIFCPL